MKSNLQKSSDRAFSDWIGVIRRAFQAGYDQLTAQPHSRLSSRPRRCGLCDKALEDNGLYCVPCEIRISEEEESWRDHEQRQEAERIAQVVVEKLNEA